MIVTGLTERFARRAIQAVGVLQCSRGKVLIIALNFLPLAAYLLILLHPLNDDREHFIVSYTVPDSLVLNVSANFVLLKKG